MVITKVSPYLPEVVELIEMLNQHNLSYYPPEECHLDPPDVLAKDNCIMFGAFLGKEICGIGAIKLFHDYGEVKRMFVSPKYRSKGVAQLILNELIRVVPEKGMHIVRLETGEKFEAAMKLYKKNGFKECEPFGQYRVEQHCVCMELKLP